MPTLDDLLLAQDGVVSRRQLLDVGLDDNDIERRLRRRDWARVHRGVYVNHTGPLTQRQRAWAACLFYWPAVLSHRSAIDPGAPSDTIHVAIEHPRRPTTRLTGVRVHRLHGLDARAAWHLGPPRMRIEEAVLDESSVAPTTADALAVVAQACQERRTTPDRLIAALAGRRRMRHGRWLREVLVDVADGVMSVLEHAYLVRVERAHGLPRGSRQRPAATSDGRGYRDVEYETFGLIVELDGGLWHGQLRQRAKDLDRDLDAAADGRRSVRLSWAQTVDRPCSTAARLARILQRLGWQGAPRPCGPSCVLSGVLPTPSAGRSPRKDAG